MLEPSFVATLVHREEKQADQHHGHDHHGQGRSERPVARGRELQLNEAPEHELLATAQQVRSDERAQGRDEDQDRARHDTRRRQRKRHVAQRGPAVGIEVAGGFDQTLVEPKNGYRFIEDFC